jgi:nitric oxide reductase NorQ protein
VDAANLQGEISYVLGSEFQSVQEILNLEPQSLATQINTALERSASEQPVSDVFPQVPTTVGEELYDSGYTTLYDIAELDAEDLPDEDVFDQYRGQIQTAIFEARDEIIHLDASEAKTIQAELELALPTAPHVARTRLDSWDNHPNGGTGRLVHLGEEELNRESRPRALAKDYSNLDVEPETDPGVQFVVEAGEDDEDPVLTGFQVLADDSYDNIPVPGEDLPADEDGTPVRPAPATDAKKGVQVLEYTARKLARDDPVFLLGPRGVGKDFRAKYLAWATNRGHRLIDCSSGIRAEHLFGTLSPDESGRVIVRDGPLKRGLLNPDIVVLSEFTALSPDAMMKLHGLLAEGEILIDYQNQLVEPHPASRIIATGNPGDKLEYKGAQEPNTATKARFRPVFVTAPDDQHEEKDAIAAQVNRRRQVISDSLLEKLVEFARRTRRDENESWPSLSPRSLVDICQDIADRTPPQQAIISQVHWLAHKHMETDEPEQRVREIFDS